MRVWAFVSIIGLFGCNAPDPHFRDVTPVRVKVDESVFDIRVRGNLAEAIRVNPQYAPRFGPIRDRAAIAMAQVSGCDVVDVLGDQAQATGLLSCEGRDPGWAIKAAIAAPRYDCIELSGWATEHTGQRYYDYECSPY
ncbi:MAG: hypothetical protein GJ676_21370 [Rhodobacteraceae bacterium]|nr:hypothetical protein [Paracoccaceae bacterium]